MNTAVHTDSAPKAVGPYSQAVKSGNLIFCAGQIGLSSATNTLVEGGIEKETVQVFENLKAVVTAAGASFADVVRVDVFMTDIADFPKVNEIYATYFPTDPKPARQTVGVAALPKGARIEISLIISR